MIKRFREALAPTSPDPNIAQRQYVLNLILFGLSLLGFVLGLTFLILWLLKRAPLAGAVAGLAVQPFFYLAYWLSRNGRPQVAGYIPTTVVFSVLVASLFQAGFGHVSITIGMAMVLFIAASSGFDYVASWTIKAISVRKQQGNNGD